MSVTDPKLKAPCCVPFFHKWTKWLAIERGDVMTAVSRRKDGQAVPLGMYEYQRRECLKCGKSQLREVQS